jgi:hypothetical protein
MAPACQEYPGSRGGKGFRNRTTQRSTGAVDHGVLILQHIVFLQFKNSPAHPHFSYIHIMKIRAIITGASGMVGEGVLLECLEHPEVEQVLVIGRKPCGHEHPKLREILHADFFNLDLIASRLAGYNACFFCLGISSVGIGKAEYKRITQDLTLHAGETMAGQNPAMTFCYVTGAGTDSSEKGRVAWARVKGATENALLRLFPNGYMFRPGAMKATRGQQNLKSWYRYLAWLYPVLHALYPAGSCTLREVGRAMIHITLHGYPKKVLEVKDIVAAAKT